MHTSNTFRSEIEYRGARLRQRVATPRPRRLRLPLTRRATDEGGTC